MRRIAAIDVGTNTVMCLVADVSQDGALTVVADEERFARLGEDVDANGAFTEAAMDRVLDRLDEAKRTVHDLECEHLVIGATSASREASNVGALVHRVREELGLEYRVLTGEQEAEFTCRGTMSMVPDLREAFVLDIGGGSTEIILWRRGAVLFQTSLDI
ncbi:MAG: exopolyphosphatase, partial [Rubricoccaceae bacterium]|nr:exopolyphosphatase [Rubricoccaceae bacterium]